MVSRQSWRIIKYKFYTIINALNRELKKKIVLIRQMRMKLKYNVSKPIIGTNINYNRIK